MVHLQNYRKNAGFVTQEAVAKKMNVNRASVARWELGITYPNQKRLFQLAQLYDTTIEAILIACKNAHENRQNSA